MKLLTFKILSLPFQMEGSTKQLTLSLRDYIGARFREANIACTFTNSNDNEFTIASRDSINGNFVSSQVNKIPLKPTDPRVAKTGRDYLNTKKLTKAQWLVMKEVCTTLWTDYDIKVEIKYKMKDNPNLTVLCCPGLIGIFPEPVSFAQKMENT